MQRISREGWLAFGLVAFLVIATALPVIWQTRTEIIPALVSSSSEQDGARALRLWLEEKGYQVSAKSGSDFSPPKDSELVLVLEPYYRLDEAHWQALDQWVMGGGILIVAGQGWGVEQIFFHYNFDMIRAEFGSLVTAQTPLLASAPMVDLSHLEVVSAFTTDREDFVTYLAAGDDPVLVAFHLGEGRVILASFNSPFTNAGLKEPGNPELILNLLALASPLEHIWFDDWHHETGKSLSVVGPQEWLRYTPAGHALLWISAVLFLSLVLHGRPFGRAVPAPKMVTRRSSLEFITALANLSRRAGHRAEVLQQYRAALKNNLSRRYRLDPEMPDEAFVIQLGLIHPDTNTNALSDLLHRLGKPRVGESEMVKLAIETAERLRDDV